ncbi:hypothetical protein FRC06_006534 [Ceratobasidium sp. 370]|nr:hypothetical protein FRC06_006534 [Ceratobasidium sp. 370]
MPGRTVTGELTPTNPAGSDFEPTAQPQHKHAPTPPCETATGTPNHEKRLYFDKRENTFVERFPDPRAGTPITDKTAPMLDLDVYMAATGNLGNPSHFDTAELLLTTGLTAAGRDQHLKSHLYVGNTPWKTNKALMDDVDKLPHGPGWRVYEIVTKVAGQADMRSYLFTRNIVDVVCEIMVDPAFKEFMHYAPE